MYLISRIPFSKTQSLVDRINERTDCKVTLDDLADKTALKSAIDGSHILTNGTSVGMSPNTEGCLIEDMTLFRPDLIVSDVIYNPEETKLLRLAREHGCQTFNGLYMLLYQGAAAFKLWTGQDMPVDVIKEKYFTR